MMLTQEVLKEWLNYDLATGLFTWAKSRDRGKVQKGRQAGCLHPDGYNKIRILGELLRCGRLAVLWMTGGWVDTVDHINLNRGDDRWINLRVATRSQNQMNRPKQLNNKSGYKGVFWNSQRQRWNAKIQRGAKQYHLGFFDDPAVAHQAYIVAAKKLHKEFARTK